MGRWRVSFGVVLLSLMVLACSEQESAEPAPGSKPSAVPLAASSVVSAAMQEVRPTFEHPAQVEAMQRAEVTPEVAATLTVTHFKAGDVVAEGDLLVELDADLYQTALDVAEAGLLSAEANQVQAKANWDRAEQLMPKGYISALDHDTAKASLGMAEADVAKALAELEKAKLDLMHTRIYAPFDGRISKPLFASGDYLTPTGGEIFQLVQLDPIYVIASIPLDIYNHFVLLRESLVRDGLDIPELMVSLRLAGGEDYPYRGTFENWAHESDSASGMINARAVFPNPAGLLLPGQNVTVLGEAAHPVARLMVPQRAVAQDQQGSYVMVVDEDSRVARRNIRTGLRVDEDWAVLGGLEEGERVIAQGAQNLRAGMQVSVGDEH